MMRSHAYVGLWKKSALELHIVHRRRIKPEQRSEAPHRLEGMGGELRARQRRGNGLTITSDGHVPVSDDNGNALTIETWGEYGDEGLIDALLRYAQRAPQNGTRNLFTPRTGEPTLR
jgi:hypothetical protein